MSPLVSFVVPSYNYAHFLPDCLTSILRQDGADFEVIVVDDGSTDDTAQVLRAFSDPRIRVIRHPTNLGHARAVNDGLGEARGTFIARIDPDDRYRPCFLSAALEKFRAFPDVGLVYGDAALINERGEVTVERSDRVHAGRDFKGREFEPLLEENFICAPTVIARREAWQRAGPAPVGLAFHDWYFTLMMAREFDFYYVNRVLAEYRVHAANLHSRIVQDRSEEWSIFWLLNRLFEEREKTPELEEQKQAARRRAYGAQSLTLANKYFGFGMDADARRCYLRAVRCRPGYLLRPNVMRRLAGTFVGRKTYERSKALAKRALRLRPNQ